MVGLFQRKTPTFGEESQLLNPGNQWIHDLLDIGSPAGWLSRCVKWCQVQVHFADDPSAEPRAIGSNCRGTTDRADAA